MVILNIMRVYSDNRGHPELQLGGETFHKPALCSYIALVATQQPPLADIVLAILHKRDKIHLHESQ